MTVASASCGDVLRRMCRNGRRNVECCKRANRKARDEEVSDGGQVPVGQRGPSDLVCGLE